MARLPQPGGDSGNWGTILNDYLSQAHKPDGAIKNNAVTASALAPNSVTNAALASDSVNATTIADGTITEVLLSASVQTKLNATLTEDSVTRTKLAPAVRTELDSYQTQAEVDARISAANGGNLGTKIIGMSESYTAYTQVGTSNQLVGQVIFTSTGVTCRVRVVGGTVTSVGAVVADWTLVEGVSGKIIRRVTRSLAANIADPVPSIERLWEPTAGFNSVRLFLKLSASQSTTIANNPVGEESPLQLIVEEVSL